MTAAELTTETTTQLGPFGDKYMMVIMTGTGVNATDFCTFTTLTTLKGVIGFDSAGLAAAGAFTSNIFTFSNGASGTKAWTLYAWGI